MPAVLAGRHREDSKPYSIRRTRWGRSAGSLWNSFMAVVEGLRPKAVLVENVPELPSWDDGAVLIGFYERLRPSGTRSTRDP